MPIFHLPSSISAAKLLPFLLPTLLLAQETTPTPRVQNWLKADQNNDGQLSPTETTGLMTRNFGRIDTNADGHLDQAELAALDQRLAAQQKRRPNNDPRANNWSPPEGVILKKDLPYREGHEKWKADLYLPQGDAPEGGRPGLVIVHGGGWRSGDKSGGQWSTLPALYAQKGYVCISVNYRLTTDGGGFPNCVEDVKCAVRWFRANAKEFGLDPARIGAYGNSAGAHLVSMLGLVPKNAKLEGDGPHQKQSSLVQAVCATATPSDFLRWGKPLEGFGLLTTNSPPDLQAAARAASPVTYAHKDAPPFLLVHAKDDRTVPFNQGKALADALQAAGADATLMAYDDGGHGVFGAKRDETYPAMEAFFAKALKTSPEKPPGKKL